MSILLLILKWIGILLGIVFLLLLLLISAVLFVPVRYRVSVNNKETLKYSFKVSFLMSILSVKKKNSGQITFSVFHLPIKKIGETKDKTGKSESVESVETETVEEQSDKTEKRQPKEPVLSVQEEKENDDIKQKRKRKNKKKNFSFQKLSSIMKCVKMNKKMLKRLIKEIKALACYLSPQKVKGKVVFGTGDPSSTGLLTGFISLFPVVYQDGVSVMPDFEEKKIIADLSVKGRVRAIYFLRLFLRLYRDREWKRMWKQIQTLKKEAL